jgi:hypothetical protein
MQYRHKINLHPGIIVNNPVRVPDSAQPPAKKTAGQIEKETGT